MIDKEINHLSWLFEACKEQFRYIFVELKQYNKINCNTQNINGYISHLKMSQNLFKISILNYSKCIANNRLNHVTLTNIDNLYIKRALVQEQLALKYLILEVSNFPSSFLQSIKKETIKLNGMIINLGVDLNKLDNKYFNN